MSDEIGVKALPERPEFKFGVAKLCDGDGRTFRGGEVVPGGQNLKNHIIFFAQSKFWLGQKNRAQCLEFLAETKFVKNIFSYCFVFNHPPPIINDLSV